MVIQVSTETLGCFPSAIVTSVKQSGGEALLTGPPSPNASDKLADHCPQSGVVRLLRRDLYHRTPSYWQRERQLAHPGTAPHVQSALRPHCLFSLNVGVRGERKSP